MNIRKKTTLRTGITLAECIHFHQNTYVIQIGNFFLGGGEKCLESAADSHLTSSHLLETFTLNDKNCIHLAILYDLRFHTIFKRKIHL